MAFYIAVPLIILFASANFIARIAVEKELHSLLKQYEPYVFAKFSHVHINIFTGSLKIDSVYILYNPLVNTGHAHKIYFPSIDMDGVHFFALLSKKLLVATTIRLNDGIVNGSDYLLRKDTGLVKMQRHGLPFDSTRINTITLTNLKMTASDKKDTTLQLDGDISVYDVRAKGISGSPGMSVAYYPQLKCEIHNIYYSLSNLFALRAKRFMVNSSDSVMEINSLRLIPTQGKYETGNKAGYQEDHISATIALIKCSGLRFNSLVQKKFIARDVTISNSILYAFRDRRLPRRKIVQPMPLDYLRQLPFDIYISKFNLEDATATSEEFPAKGNQPGFIKLAHIYINMEPVINHLSKKSAKYIRSHVKASVMNAGLIYADLNLSLQTGVTDIRGTIENLELPSLNPSAENLGMFHIESGILNKLDFQFTANDKKATGKIIGVYHHLKIDRLKNTKHGKKVAWLPSFALHHFIIPENKDESLAVKKRTGEINYERDPTRMVTFYYLKALLSGIRDSFSLGFLLPK
jgi:hypothetical protein